MKIKFSYSELEEVVFAQFHVRVDLRCVNVKTVYVGTTIPVAFFKKSVGVDIIIERLEGTDLYLSYVTGIGVNLIIQGIMHFLHTRGLKYGRIVEPQSANLFVVHLAAIVQMKEALKFVVLKHICFENDGVMLYADFKM